MMTEARAGMSILHRNYQCKCEVPLFLHFSCFDASGGGLGCHLEVFWRPWGTIFLTFEGLGAGLEIS